MLDVRETDEFSEWLRALRDARARAKILIRIDRLANGNPGNVAPVGEGVSELRINYGPGYRVYYVQRGTSAGWWRQGYARQGYRSSQTPGRRV